MKKPNVGKESAVVKVGEDQASFLAQYQEADESLAAVKGYRVLPWLRLVQSQSDRATRDSLGEGAVVLSPGGALVAGYQEPFLFVPLLMVPEFIKWRDRDDKSGPAIVDRSFDRGGEIAAKANDPELRTEEYFVGEGKKAVRYEYRYVEHLNFPGVVYGDSPLAGTTCVLQFARGEWGIGKNLCSSIMLRRVNGRTAPLWSQVWQFQSNPRDRKGYQWYGIDFAQPNKLYIDEAEAEKFLSMHVELAALHEKRRLVVDRSEPEEAEVESGGSAAAAEDDM